MPIYDYVCRNCGHIVEVIHGVNDQGPTVCLVCGGPLRKALSTPAIHFKGSGWAKKERSSKSAAAKSGDADKSGSASGPSGDAGAKTDSAKTTAGASSEAS